MILADTLRALMDAGDRLCRRVFEGHEGRFVALMLLMFAIVGGME